LVREGVALGGRERWWRRKGGAWTQG